MKLLWALRSVKCGSASSHLLAHWGPHYQRRSLSLRRRRRRLSAPLRCQRRCLCLWDGDGVPTLSAALSLSLRQRRSRLSAPLRCQRRCCRFAGQTSIEGDAQSTRSYCWLTDSLPPFTFIIIALISLHCFLLWLIILIPSSLYPSLSPLHYPRPHHILHACCHGYWVSFLPSFLPAVVKSFATVHCFLPFDCCCCCFTLRLIVLFWNFTVN